MRRPKMSLVRLLFFLWIFVPSVAGDSAQPVYATSGDDVTLTWRFPEEVNTGSVMVSLDASTNPVFLASVGKGRLLGVKVMKTYREKFTVNDTLVEGHMLLTISNVTSEYAGTYLCLKGLSEKDIIPSCGQTLVVIEAPQELMVMPLGDPVQGGNLTLRCTASSVSRPRDQNRPMIFRWFDSAESDGPSFTASPAGHENASAGGRQQEQESVKLGRKVDVEELPVTGVSLTNDTITIRLLGRSDEGRRLACRASEGLGVWSEWSENFIVHPQWGPTEKDMRLTPSENVITVASGRSVKVTCTSECRPKCDFTWKKVISTETSVLVTTGHTLTLSNISIAEEGVYACVANNIHGRSSKPLFVDVTEKHTEMSASVGDDSLISDHNRLALVLIAVSAAGIALGMTGAAYIFHEWRKHSQSARWRARRQSSDRVPLSFMRSFRNDSEVT